MNLADPDSSRLLDLLDPKLNVHELFVLYDKKFFYSSLSKRAEVRWSKKMFSNVGYCWFFEAGTWHGVSYCDIALSEPLLKLRPIKDLVETLLHEMIHAYLFISNDQDRYHHGPSFKAHMQRINNATGLNISIYHDFYAEMDVYRTHVWRCNGPCQKESPFFGIVRRHNNRVPGPSEFWWNVHTRKCGGTFIKIKEPEKKNKSPTNIANDTKPNPLQVFGGKGQTLIVNPLQTIRRIWATKQLIFNDITETVRNVWYCKQLIINNITETVRSVWYSKKIQGNTDETKKSSLKRGSPKHEEDSPPKKVIKIDDYFNSHK